MNQNQTIISILLGYQRAQVFQKHCVTDLYWLDRL